MTSDTSNSGNLAWRVPEWFPHLNENTLSKLQSYHAEILHFNKRINLISPRTEADSDATHIADAIFASEILLKTSDKREIYDIGSGNGIPGIVLAILAPDRVVRLLDSDTRKIEFLKHSISKLGLKNCFPTHARAEGLGDEVLTCGICRGFASLAKTLLALRRIAAPGCELFHMKGESWPGEVAEIPAQILASWEPNLVGGYVLPVTGSKLSVILSIRK